MGFGFGVKQRTDRKRTVSSSSSSTIVPQENQKNESTLNSKEANSTVGKSAVNIRDSKTKAAIDSCMNTVILCVMVDMMGISLTVPINVAYALQVQGNPQSCIADYYSTECSEAMAALKIKTGYLATAASIAMFISTM